jgi:hypothetical protein
METDRYCGESRTNLFPSMKDVCMYVCICAQLSHGTTNCKNLDILRFHSDWQLRPVSKSSNSESLVGRLRRRDWRGCSCHLWSKIFFSVFTHFSNPAKIPGEEAEERLKTLQSCKMFTARSFWVSKKFVKVSRCRLRLQTAVNQTFRTVETWTCKNI